MKDDQPGSGRTSSKGRIKVSPGAMASLRERMERHEEVHRQMRRRFIGEIKLAVTLMTEEEWAEIMEARRRRPE